MPLVSNHSLSGKQHPAPPGGQIRIQRVGFTVKLHLDKVLEGQIFSRSRLLGVSRGAVACSMRVASRQRAHVAERKGEVQVWDLHPRHRLRCAPFLLGHNGCARCHQTPGTSNRKRGGVLGPRCSGAFEVYTRCAVGRRFFCDVLQQTACWGGGAL